MDWVIYRLVNYMTRLDLEGGIKINNKIFNGIATRHCREDCIALFIMKKNSKVRLCLEIRDSTVEAFVD